MSILVFKTKIVQWFESIKEVTFGTKKENNDAISVKKHEETKSEEPPVPVVIDTCIKILNKLHRLKRTAIIELPQLVVVGNQSSGKSSTLEGIVGREFLPRGEGMVTRCPLILQLRHNSDGKKIVDGKEVCEWAEFGHKDNECFSDFNKVRDEIRKRTDELAPKKTINDKEITLTIHSKNVPDLSLIDLPGITSIEEADQEESTTVNIKSLINKYIKNPQSIILAIVNAVADDFTTNMCLKMAKEADEGGNRTICVLTKVDRIEDKSRKQIEKVLRGEVHFYRHGIIGVINRIEGSDMTFDKALKHEKNVFKDLFPEIKDKNGTHYLSERLSDILKQHVTTSLPTLGNKWIEERTQCEKLLETLGEEVTFDTQKGILSQCINDFVEDFKASIEGGIDLAVGASIKKIFQESLKTDLDKINVFANLSDAEISSTITNMKGVKLDLVPSEQSFEALMKKQLILLKDPGISCVQAVHNILKTDVSFKKFEKHAQRFPELENCLKNIYFEYLSKCHKNTELFVLEIIDMQCHYINSGMEDIMETLKKIITSTVNTQPSDTSNQTPAENGEEKEGRKADDKEDNSNEGKTKQMIKAYFEHTKKLVRELIPKAVMKFFVNEIVDNLRKELEEKLEEKLKKGADINKLLWDQKADERRRVKEDLESLKEAIKIIGEPGFIDKD